MPPNTPTKRKYVRIIPNESPPSLWSSISKLRVDDEGSETASLTGSDTTIKPQKTPSAPPSSTIPNIQLELPHISSAETEAKTYPLTHYTPLFHHLDTSSTGFKILVPASHNQITPSLYNDYANTSNYYSIPRLETPNDLPYNDPSNLSPYYGMPLLEPPSNAQSFEADRWDRICSLDKEPLQQASDAKGLASDSDSDGSLWDDFLFEKRLTPRPPRPMSPSQSLLLYLWGRGFSEEFIGTELGRLEAAFFGEEAVRRYVRDRTGEWVYVPPHWKMDDRVVRDVVETFMEEEEEWEKEGGKGVWLKKRWRGRGVEKAVRGLVEGYLMWRIKGI